MAVVNLNVGAATWTLDFDQARLVSPLPAASAPAKPAYDQVRDALERPLRFEALRRALTPDDHVAVVLDECLPRLAPMIAAILEHLLSAGISPEAVTLISPNPHSQQLWLDGLPDALADVKAEVHQPHEPKKLAYLATTKTDHRIYLNRTTVEAEFVVVLTAHRFHGHNGETLLGHDIADHATQAAKPKSDETTEVAWLLGTPFFVRVIEGTGEAVEHVISGFADTKADADELRNQRWLLKLDAVADVVVATVPEPGASFSDVAYAIATAAKAVKPGGRIVLVTAATPAWPAALHMLSDDEPADRKRLKHDKPEGWMDVIHWRDAAAGQSVYIAADWPADEIEHLGATALTNAAELQRLLVTGQVAYLPDAHRTHVKLHAENA